MRSAPARRGRPLLSEGSSPGDAAEAAALVLATQEFVANSSVESALARSKAVYEGRPSRCHWSAASPRWTGSLGRVGQRGVVTFQLAILAGSSRDFRVLPMRWSRAAGETACPRPRGQR
jgi:hypothetical protein